ncbi:hypothetical protein V8E55_010127 [Tylopilus felleus]
MSSHTIAHRNHIAMKVSKAITKIRRIALRFGPKWFGRSIGLESLASLLYAQFKSRGTISDLDEALALQRNGHPDRATSLKTISHYHHTRFMRLGTLSDLDEALSLARNALELLPQDHPNRAAWLSDLDEALTIECDALKLYQQGDPNRAIPLGNIASYLHIRFKQLGTLSDLNEAITLQRNALDLRPTWASFPRRFTGQHRGLPPCPFYPARDVA